MSPAGIAFDPKNSLHIADARNHRIRRIGSDGLVTMFAGTGVDGDQGDGGPTLAAQLHYPLYPVFDRVGNLYFAQNE